MASMFEGALAFNGDISGFDLQNVKTTERMFFNAEKFNVDISGYNVGSVTTFAQMFEDAAAFDQSLCSWNLANSPDVTNMFKDAGCSIFQGTGAPPYTDPDLNLNPISPMCAFCGA